MTQRSEILVGDRIVVLACYCVSGPAQTCDVVVSSAGLSFVRKQVHWGPRVYKPDKSCWIYNSREDSIPWRWTIDGEYLARSAYCIQFEGTFSKMRIMHIWKAKAEPSVDFLLGLYSIIRS